MKVYDEIEFYGHSNILATHQKTIEITKDDYLTREGNCIIGIKANKACINLNATLQKLIKKDNTPIKVEIIVGVDKFQINGFGNKNLTLLHQHDIVIRKSNFVCSRTALVKCDKASIHIPREIISKLQFPHTKGILRITAFEC
jgi:uncharacterized protein